MAVYNGENSVMEETSKCKIFIALNHSTPGGSGCDFVCNYGNLITMAADTYMA